MPLGGQQTVVCGSDRAATLVETVTDRATHIPLTGAAVSATWRDGAYELHARAQTDSTGKAIICAPPAILLSLRAEYFNISNGSETTTLSAARPTSHTTMIDLPHVFVRGIVVDQETGQAISNVAVRVANTTLQALTNAEGRFFFDRIPVGDYSFNVQHLSYGVTRAPVSVREDDLNAAISLAPEAIPIKPIVVTSFSRRLEFVGFYERQKRGIGTFINRKQIDAMNVQYASDLLRSVPSLRIITQSPRRNTPRSATPGRGGCRVRFMVDGARTLNDFEIDNVSADAMEGIEVYAGLAEVPALFRAQPASDPSGGVCGVVVIWTRNSR